MRNHFILISMCACCALRMVVGEHTKISNALRRIGVQFAVFKLPLSICQFSGHTSGCRTWHTLAQWEELVKIDTMNCCSSEWRVHHKIILLLQTRIAQRLVDGHDKPTSILNCVQCMSAVSAHCCQNRILASGALKQKVDNNIHTIRYLLYWQHESLLVLALSARHAQQYMQTHRTWIMDNVRHYAIDSSRTREVNEWRRER